MQPQLTSTKPIQALTLLSERLPFWFLPFPLAQPKLA